MIAPLALTDVEREVLMQVASFEELDAVAKLARIFDFECRWRTGLAIECEDQKQPVYRSFVALVKLAQDELSAKLSPDVPAADPVNPVAAHGACLMKKPQSPVEDDHGDLRVAVGTATDAATRQRCLDLARGMIPRGYEPEDAAGLALLIARRFSRFILDGTTPSLRWVNLDVSTPDVPSSPIDHTSEAVRPTPC